MPDRITRLLRIATFLLLLGLVARTALVLLRPNPVANLRIPEIPTLARPGTTNLTPATAASSPVPPPSTPPKATGTNSSGTNMLASTAATNAPGTNTVSAPKPPTPNPALPGMPPPGLMPPGMAPGGPGRGTPSLEPIVQARLDKIIQSELLGPVPRPLPMALLGIAGTNAFLRAPSGLSGMVGEGAELGGIKLLRIGTNRVLVSEGGTNKELTIFGGAGGQSLLPQPIVTP